MDQCRSCESFGVSCSHLASFLCLPPDIRRRIYEEADIVTDSDIDLNGQRSDYWPSSRGEVAYALLLTCRAIYTEVCAIVYSTNRFFIEYRDAQSLGRLRSLRPEVLSCLTQLTVHLNATSCPWGSLCRKVDHREPHCFPQYEPLRSTASQHQAILSEWESTARHVIDNIAPFRLRLYFVCDVENLETAMQARKPFLSTTTLADCAIRLGQYPDRPLQNLARTTALQTTGQCLDRSKSPFRFLDLPPEVRRQILEYTDLVTPYSEVEWQPQEGYSIRYSNYYCEGTSWPDPCPEDVHYGCQFQNCWQYAKVGCLCCRTHAAFSSSCHCWSPPRSLFLTCRGLHQDSQAVFFRRNRFIIMPPGKHWELAERTPPRLGASIFLKDTVPFDALHFFRFLEIVFPPFDKDYLRPDEPAFQDWLRTIDYVREGLNLPMLTLRVYMSDHKPNGIGVTPSRGNVTKEQGLVIYSMYLRTLRPCQTFKGLHRFFVHLTWPFTWTRPAYDARCNGITFAEKQVAPLEQRIERHTMGDDYDSVLLGKEELTNSQWKIRMLDSTRYGETFWTRDAWGE